MHRPVVSIVAGLVEYEQKLGDLFFLDSAKNKFAKIWRGREGRCLKT